MVTSSPSRSSSFTLTFGPKVGHAAHTKCGIDTHSVCCTYIYIQKAGGSLFGLRLRHIAKVVLVYVCAAPSGACVMLESLDRELLHGALIDVKTCACYIEAGWDDVCDDIASHIVTHIVLRHLLCNTRCSSNSLGLHTKHKRAFIVSLYKFPAHTNGNVLASIHISIST